MQSETEQYRRIHVVQLPQQENSVVQRPVSNTKRPVSKTLKTLTHLINHNQVDAISPTQVKIEEITPTNNQRLSNVRESTNETVPSMEIRETTQISSTTANNKTKPIPEVVQKSATMTSASHSQPKQQESPSQSKHKNLLKNLLFISALVLLISTLIIVPIVVVNSLSVAASEKNSCSSARVITFDDIVTNPSWMTSSGSGVIPQGYGNFNWLSATYTNVSHIGFASTSLFSGSFVASIDNTNPSNRLRITHTRGHPFYVCSLAIASISNQIPLTISAFRSNTNVYTINVTIDSISPLLLDLSSKKSAVDSIEMFAYGLTFIFDNLAIGE